MNDDHLIMPLPSSPTAFRIELRHTDSETDAQRVVTELHLDMPQLAKIHISSCQMQLGQFENA